MFFRWKRATCARCLRATKGHQWRFCGVAKDEGGSDGSCTGRPDRTMEAALRNSWDLWDIKHQIGDSLYDIYIYISIKHHS